MAPEGRQVTLDYATPGPARVGLSRASLALLGGCALLTLLSFLVVWTNATDEPYFGGIRKSDALVQVGLGSVLVVLWLGWAGRTWWQVFRGRISPAWTLLLLWAAIVLLYLVNAIDGYLSDVIAFEKQSGL